MATNFITNFTPPETTDVYKLRAGALFYVKTTSGSAAAVTATVPGITEYYTGLTIIVKFSANAPSSGATLNINSLGAKTIKYGANTNAAYFTKNASYLFVYDGTYFVAIHSYNSNTWNANNATTAGYVASPASATHKVWSTGTSGTPAWNDDKITIAGNEVSLGESLSASTLLSSLGLSSALHFIGSTSTSIVDGSNTNPITVNSNSITATTGDVVINSNNSAEYVWITDHWELLGDESSYKIKQDEVTDPNASGTSITFIASASQDTNGVITVTKKTVRSATASQSGVVTTGAQTFAGAKTFSSTSFGPLNITRDGSTNGASIKFSNSNGTLGYIGMTSAADGGLLRWTADAGSVYTVLDTGNYKSYVNETNFPGIKKTGTVTSITLTAGAGISLDTDNTAITTSGSRTITNTGVRSITTGSANGTISVNTNGTSADVAIKGLGTAAYTDSTAYAAASHSHSYLPLRGGTMTGAITFTSQSSAFNAKNIVFSSGGVIGGNSSGDIGLYANSFCIRPNSTNTAAGANGIRIEDTSLYPDTNGTTTLGTSSKKWSTVYATTFNGNATTATKVNNSLTVQGNGTQSFTYDGSAAKTLNIKAGTNVSVSADASGNITISSTDTNTWRPVETTLTNQDLNNVTTAGFYNAGGDNSVTNKPSGVNHFGMTVIHRASGAYYTQILQVQNKTYRRYCDNGTWTAWTEDKYTDTDTNTHYTTHLYAGASGGNANAATTNGNTYLLLTDNTTNRNSIKITGSGATTVTSDANGVITISSTDNNTDTKVTQTAVTASSYTNWRSLIWGAANSGTEGFTPTTETNQVYSANTLSVQPSSGTIRVNRIKIADTTAVKHIEFARNGYNYLASPGTGSYISFLVGTNECLAKDSKLTIDTTGAVYPGTTNTGSLGTSDLKWANAYATTFHGALDGNANTASALILKSSTREPSLNYDLKTLKQKVVYSLATSAANTSKTKPGATDSSNGTDAHVLTFAWDTDTGWGAQLAVGDAQGNHLYIRGSSDNSGASNWETSWRTVLDSGNYTSYTVTKTGTGASGTWGIGITGNAATATKLATARTISLTGSVTGSGSFDGSGNLSIATTTNHNHDNRYVYDKANVSGNMNTAATWRNAMGMINLSGTDATINPNGQTGWHHFINMSYQTESTNMWQTQIANKAGTTDLWVRSRKGGTITDGTVWEAPWTKILTAANYAGTADSRYVKKSGDTMTGNLIIQRSTSASVAYDAGNPTITFKNSAGNQNCSLIFTDYDSVRAPAGIKLIGNQGNEWFEAPRVFGAVWNDYAEYRQADTIEPGCCVVEVGNDTLVLSTERLQRGCEITSDTFGFAIGKTEKCQTPIAATGRVLAYPYESREEFRKHIGWPVCSGPNGTVSIMTEEEEERYPSRIIGVISAVPDYEEWGSGKVKINGRVWIRIK